MLFNLGRAVIGAIATSYSFAFANDFLSALYLVDIVATAFLIPERKGVPLD